MPATKTKRAATIPQRSERKFGPFHGGVGVAVWLNQVQTDDRPRFFRSVTITPRRFFHRQSGEWRDAGSFRSTDLPALVLALEAARAYMASTPLPGEPVGDEEDQAEDTPPKDHGDIPF
jgi:hypothetical protein